LRAFGMPAWEADADYQSTPYRMRLVAGILCKRREHRDVAIRVEPRLCGILLPVLEQ
jgi:hypothetical protein